MRRRNRGFSLVELMVGLVVGLVVIAAVIAVFIGSRQTYQEIQRVTRLQENLRFATDFMTRDIRRAGYSADNSLPEWGQQTPPDDTGIGFGPGSFMTQWRADDGDRDCIGEEVAAGTVIQHVYAIMDDALTCTRDGVTTVLVRDVTGLQRDLISTGTGLPVGIVLTLTYRTEIANETFTHETEFRVAFRNTLLAMIETP